MSKYQPLTEFLKASSAPQLPLTFAEVETILGVKLPASAYEHPAWWANDAGKSHVQAKAWLSAGYETEQIDKQAKKLVFKRIGIAPGMAEAAREFVHAEPNEKKLGRHPAIGSMKGTFTIEPGFDLTSPMFTDEEWAEIEKEMDADWDQIEQGMSKHK
ncbi:MAG TPA: hypothetical protein VHU18_13800 [Rhizomicrobium sp.]|jgi:hypothetical protein|nr:hypothetical protein [Rhizomicrobium sp.]